LPNGKPRLEVVAILFHIRSFYLDVLQWSQTRPDIWAKYACPSPIRESDLASNRKSVLQQKARTHARIRLLQPFLSALARIIERARGNAPRIPIPRYDPLERTINAPLPYLFQGGPKRQRGVYSREYIRQLLRNASLELALRDKSGESIVFRSHDFRRLFATEAVNNGLPIHIAAKLLGHTDLNTTRGYVAVYEDEVVRHYQTHLARRRGFRPPHEYRQPSDAEWQEFAQHFRRRQMALGECYRPYGTDCPHEHACVRCPMLRMDEGQLPRLVQIEKDTLRLLKEARTKGWEGEAAGLETTLIHIKDKKAQVTRIREITNHQNALS
jgi:hypothetical protein